MWFVVKGWLGLDDPAVLDHALHAHNTRVDRGNPAIAVLSIGYQSLGSCSRAAGWSAATLCFGTFRTCHDFRVESVFESKGEVGVSNLPRGSFWHLSDMLERSLHVRCWGINGPISEAPRGLSL